MRQHRRILAARKKQDRPLALCDAFAENMDCLTLKLIKVEGCHAATCTSYRTSCHCPCQTLCKVIRPLKIRT